MKKNLIFFLSSVLLCLLVSCGSVKDIAYLQGDELLKTITFTDTASLKIQKDDLLDINVSCPDQELLRPFLRYSSEFSSGGVSGGNSSGYLVEADGTINFPLLGTIKVAGLTRRQLLELIQDRLEKDGFIKNPVVTVRFTNFRISILGEVAHPGTYTISSERITLFEALSLAGDLTIHGRRNRVAVVRETDGVRTILYHDLRSRDIFQSPDFYLKQNDMVYVEPNRVKAEASVQNQYTNIGTWISLISFLTSMSILIFK
ncbi:polysaccharide biosynthesis/export family protein [Parabacteroides sp.]